MQDNSATVKQEGEDRDLAFMMRNTEEEYYPVEDDSIHEDAACYQATAGSHVEAMLEYLRLGPEDVFVDLGCGKGRVMCRVAMERVKKVVGVELRKELYEAAREIMRGVRPVSPVEVYQEDAAGFLSTDGTVFYLFNPFGGNTVREVVKNIRESLRLNPRSIRIVYNNCVHGEYLESADWLVKEGRVPGTVTWVWRSK
ncbi:MAG: SAM-dependent methyltransferase [Endomicrobiales bacterium]